MILRSKIIAPTISPAITTVQRHNRMNLAVRRLKNKYSPYTNCALSLCHHCWLPSLYIFHVQYPSRANTSRQDAFDTTQFVQHKKYIGVCVVLFFLLHGHPSVQAYVHLETPICKRIHSIRHRRVHLFSHVVVCCARPRISRSLYRRLVLRIAVQPPHLRLHLRAYVIAALCETQYGSTVGLGNGKTNPQK